MIAQQDINEEYRDYIRTVSRVAQHNADQISKIYGHLTELAKRVDTLKKQEATLENNDQRINRLFELIYALAESVKVVNVLLGKHEDRLDRLEAVTLGAAPPLVVPVSNPQRSPSRTESQTDD